MALTVKGAAKTAGIVLCPGAYAGYKLAEYAKENPDKVKKVAKYTLLGQVFFAGQKTANYVKENPEKAKEFAKIAIIPGYGVYKAGQKTINFFKN